MKEKYDRVFEGKKGARERERGGRHEEQQKEKGEWKREISVVQDFLRL